MPSDRSLETISLLLGKKKARDIFSSSQSNTLIHIKQEPALSEVSISLNSLYMAMNVLQHV